MSAYQFKIKLEGVKKPPVWRRMVVPTDYTFTDLAKVIMIAFNWSGSHLWQFQQRDPSSREMTALIEQRDVENTLQVKFIASERLGSPRVYYDADETPLSQWPEIVGEGKLQFIYDFGDWMDHTITLEETSDMELPLALCLKGSGAPIPEDVGGAHIFQMLKEKHEAGTLEDFEKEMANVFLTPYRDERRPWEMNYNFYVADLEVINDNLELYLQLKFSQMPPHF